MATLTATEITAIRQRIGDRKTTTAGRNDLSDTEIQAEWDRANGHSSDLKAYLAYYYMLERRWGMWINATDTETGQGSKAQSQKVEQIEKLMQFYQLKAGVTGMTLSLSPGVLDFGLDQDNPETGEDLED